MKQQPDEYLTLAQVRKETGYNYRSIKTNIDNGTLPATKALVPGAVNPVWQIKRSDLDKLKVRKYVRSGKYDGRARKGQK